MMPRLSSAHFLVAAIFLLLVACDPTATAPTKSAKAHSRALTPQQMVADVRSAGSMGNDLTVAPLRDPQVEDLRLIAAQAETRSDVNSAMSAIEQALKISVLDPDLLQWKSELLLLNKNWALAESAAQLSYDKGPKLGALCRRNMKTISFAKKLRGDAAGAMNAERQLSACTVTPPPRY
jgi:Flp pilus assembly protein TadD